MLYGLSHKAGVWISTPSRGFRICLLATMYI